MELCEARESSDDAAVGNETWPADERSSVHFGSVVSTCPLKITGFEETYQSHQETEATCEYNVWSPMQGVRRPQIHGCLNGAMVVLRPSGLRAVSGGGGGTEAVDMVF